MSYREEVIDNAKKALVDVRCIGAIHYINSLLVRKTINNKEEYRLMDRDGKEITSIEDILPLITLDDIELRTIRVKKDNYTNVLSGIKLILRNVFVQTKSGIEDSWIAMDGAGEGFHNLALSMSYWNDLDNDLKLKINYVDYASTIEEVAKK